MKLYNMFRIGAQHQNSDLVLYLLDPASGSTSSPQELCCILDARFFVSCSPNRTKVSPEKQKERCGLVHGLINDFSICVFKFPVDSGRTMMRMFQNQKESSSLYVNLNSWEILDGERSHPTTLLVTAKSC